MEILFLAGVRNGRITTGQNISVDGGWTVW